MKKLTLLALIALLLINCKKEETVKPNYEIVNMDNIFPNRFMEYWNPENITDSIVVYYFGDSNHNYSFIDSITFENNITIEENVNNDYLILYQKFQSNQERIPYNKTKKSFIIKDLIDISSIGFTAKYTNKANFEKIKVYRPITKNI